MITNTIVVNEVKMFIITQCDLCGHENYPIEVDQHQYASWQTGAFIQNAFPYMSINNREKLLSGMCDKCSKELDEAEAEAERREYEEMIAAEENEYRNSLEFEMRAERLREYND